MRHPVFVALCLTGTVALSACQKSSDAEVQRAIQSVNVIDETNLNDIMLTVGDPNEAVAYFTKAVSGQPDRVDLARPWQIADPRQPRARGRHRLVQHRQFPRRHAR